MKFEEDLEQKIWPEWKQHYINYHLLKAKLSDILHAQETKQEEIIKARKHIFQGALDEELEKVSLQAAVKLSFEISCLMCASDSVEIPLRFQGSLNRVSLKLLLIVANEWPLPPW